MIKDLVTQKDIRAIEAKSDKMGKLTHDEATLLQTAKWSEFHIQSACYNLFKSARFGDNAIFVQIDNGGSAEGIRNCMIVVWNKNRPSSCGMRWSESEKAFLGYPIYDKTTIYIEFESIKGKIAENQQKWHQFLKEKGESVYYCNNIVFFEKIIMKEIEEFLK